jgi:hypothetical protein
MDKEVRFAEEESTLAFDDISLRYAKGKISK